jgi:hypothetical protein
LAIGKDDLPVVVRFAFVDPRDSFNLIAIKYQGLVGHLYLRSDVVDLGVVAE